MWDGARMLAKWAIEFGFHMGAIYTHRSSFVDVAGRELIREFGLETMGDYLARVRRHRKKSLEGNYPADH
jgi:hypothetical protein